jgi:hypothetical protein
MLQSDYGSEGNSGLSDSSNSQAATSGEPPSDCIINNSSKVNLLAEIEDKNDSADDSTTNSESYTGERISTVFGDVKIDLHGVDNHEGTSDYSTSDFDSNEYTYDEENFADYSHRTLEEIMKDLEEYMGPESEDELWKIRMDILPRRFHQRMILLLQETIF